MADSYRELLDRPKDQLIREYDQLAPTTQLGLSVLREGLARRELAEHTQEMARLTRQMYRMTVAIVVLTAINVLAVLWVLFRG